MLCVDTGEKLAMARDYHAPALTQEAFAKLLGVDTSTVGRWESKNHIPVARRAEVSHILNVREDWFFDNSDDPPTLHRLYPEQGNIRSKAREDLTPNERRIVEGLDVALPLWRGVVAGDTGECVFVEPDSPETREIPAFYTRGEPDRHVLVIASGMSMHPRIDHAERALIRLDPDVPAGHLVVARNPDGQNFIKRLVKDSGALRLESLNAEFQPITDLKGWIMKGGVTAIFHAYEPGRANIEWDDGRYLR